MLEALIVIGLFNAGLITIADKTGIRERLMIYSPSKTIYDLLECNFCLGFWLALFELIPYVCYFDKSYDYFLLTLACATTTKLAS